MPKFEVGDLVRVRPKFWQYRHHETDIGTVADIKPNLVAPYLVDFNGKKELFAEGELEKI